MKRTEQTNILNSIAKENGFVWEQIILYNSKETYKLFKKWIKKAQLDELDDVAYLIRLTNKALKNGYTKDWRKW